jgi:hypothetical protein
MDFWVILYSLICIVVGGGFVSMLFNRGQQMGAMTLLVLLILVFLFYGLRWFPGGNLNGTKTGAVVWPPIVNVCPDFMVSWTDKLTNKVYCYDAANIYGLQASTAAPPLIGSLTIGTASSQTAYLLKDPTQGSTTSTLSAAPARWPLISALTTRSSDVLTTAAKYLRWEGVWDGQTLTAAKAPLP